MSRLDTRRDEKGGGRPERKERGGRDAPAAKYDDQPKREPGFRARKANVWMAPGARPLAEKKPKDAQAADAAEKPVRRERPEGAPATKRYGRNKDGVATKSTRKFDPDRKKASVYDRPDRGPRVLVTRDDDDKDWIRATEEPSRDEGRGGDRKRFGGDDRGARSFGDRAPRGDRPQGDRPPRRENGDRPAGDKPRGKSFGGKPGGAKPFGAKAGGPRDGRPGGGRPSGGKPSGGRPSGGRPPAGGKPRGRGN